MCCPFNAVPAKEAARLEKMSSQRSGSARATTLAELKLQQRLLKDQLKTTETSLEKARTLILKKKINKMVVSEAAEVNMNPDRRIGGGGRALVHDWAQGAGGVDAVVNALRAHPSNQKLQQMCRAAISEMKVDDG